jgi:uncharacterized integral membrane protein
LAACAAERRDTLWVLSSYLSQFGAVPLDQHDYWLVIERVSGLSLPAGGIYDALHAQAALKSIADQLLTFNAKHFVRLGDDVAALARVP